jgi:hypothetical protein
MMRFLVTFLLLPLVATPAPRPVVPLEVRDGGCPHVPVRLADDVDAVVMLDTAAGINTLAPRVMRALGGAVRAAGSTPAPATTVRR